MFGTDQLATETKKKVAIFWLKCKDEYKNQKSVSDLKTIIFNIVTATDDATDATDSDADDDDTAMNVHH